MNKICLPYEFFETHELRNVFIAAAWGVCCCWHYCPNYAAVVIIGSGHVLYSITSVADGLVIEFHGLLSRGLICQGLYPKRENLEVVI